RRSREGPAELVRPGRLAGRGTDLVVGRWRRHPAYVPARGPSLDSQRRPRAAATAGGPGRPTSLPERARLRSPTPGPLLPGRLRRDDPRRRPEDLAADPLGAGRHPAL